MSTDHAAGWQVYLVRCADGSYYTGIARDLTARIDSHNQGTGAKYTRGRGPVELVYAEPARTGARRRVVNGSCVASAPRKSGVWPNSSRKGSGLRRLIEGPADLRG